MEPHLDILGPELPPNAKSYFEKEEVIDRIASQYKNINETRKLPDWAGEQYQWGIRTLQLERVK